MMLYYRGKKSVVLVSINKIRRSVKEEINQGKFSQNKMAEKERQMYMYHQSLKSVNIIDNKRLKKTL